MSEAARESFLNLAGIDGEIDAYELRDILNQVFLGGKCFHAMFLTIFITPF